MPGKAHYSKNIIELCFFVIIQNLLGLTNINRWKIILSLIIIDFVFSIGGLKRFYRVSIGKSQVNNITMYLPDFY